MKTYFILLNLNLKNNNKERTVPNYWGKVLKNLYIGKAKVLYQCDDTSADVFIRDHAEKLLLFTTYILLTVNLADLDENTIREAIISELDGKLIKYVLTSNNRYEVITNETMS